LLRGVRLGARRTGGGPRHARPGRGGLQARDDGSGPSAGGAGRSRLPAAGRRAGGRRRHAAFAGRRSRPRVLAWLPQLFRHHPLQPVADVRAGGAPAGAGDPRGKRRRRAMRLLAAAAIALALAACSGAPKKSGPPPAATAATPTAEGAQRPRKSPYAPAQEDPSKRGDYVAGGLYAPHIRDSAPDYIPDVDAIPEPEVVDEPRSRYGNRSPY